MVSPLTHVQLFVHPDTKLVSQINYKDHCFIKLKVYTSAVAIFCHQNWLFYDKNFE